MDDNIAIKVQGVSKTFKDQASATTIKHSFIELGRKIAGKPEQHKKRGFTALKDISFEVKKGEFFGIVGRNGCGKSTLLKMIAGVYSPTSGNIQVNGNLTPFIELGVGFNPELTGKDNVYLNSALLGFTHKQTDAMYKEIVDFAELHDFMDTKLKNYSSGMQVRLAFSVAIRAESDILLLDEVLAVGDEAFQKKCYGYFAKLKKDKKTVVLVTHSMDYIQQFCTDALLIDGGAIKKIGNPAHIAQSYRELFININKVKSENNKQLPITANKSQKPINNLVNITAKVDNEDDRVNLEVRLVPKQIIRDAIVSVFIDRDNGEQVYRFSTDEKFGESLEMISDKLIKLNISLQNIFPNGIFSIRVSVKSRDRSVEYASKSELDSFEIDHRIRNKSEWDIHWHPAEEFKINT